MADQARAHGGALARSGSGLGAANGVVRPFDAQREAIGDRRYLGMYDARFHSTHRCAQAALKAGLAFVRACPVQCCAGLHFKPQELCHVVCTTFEPSGANENCLCRGALKMRSSQ